MQLNIMYRKALYVFLSVMIVFANIQSAYANMSVGGWSAVDTVIAGATTTINATKSAGGKVLQSAVTVAPSAVKLGKHLIKGGGSAALLIAVPQLLGDGVDWVLDPANNAVKYKDPASGGATGNPAPSGKVWHTGANGGMTSKSADDLCQRTFNYFVSIGHSIVKGGHSPVVKNITSDGASCYFTSSSDKSTLLDNFSLKVDASAGDGGTPSDDYKYLPIDTVAAQVISNAEAGDPSSQDAVKATALEGFAAGEHDAALDAAATEAGSDAGTDNPPDTSNPPDTGDPAVPFDPSSIIAAINALKAMLAGILSSMTGFFDWWTTQWETFATSFTELKDWATTEPAPLEPEPVTVIDDVDIGGWQDKANAGYVQFGGQCPSDVEIPINYMGASTNLSISYTPFCQFASMIKPAVILGAWISAMLIISGGRARES